LKDKRRKLAITIQNLLRREEGQDLIEYALVVSLLALAVKAAMRGVAGAINTAFANIGTKLTSYSG
jgi:pilus assembly protein Flp/PilA